MGINRSVGLGNAPVPVPVNPAGESDSIDALADRIRRFDARSMRWRARPSAGTLSNPDGFARLANS